VRVDRQRCETGIERLAAHEAVAERAEADQQSGEGKQHRSEFAKHEDAPLQMTSNPLQRGWSD
jgi:hypothetical protein